MRDPNWKRVARLAVDLATSPRELVRYLRYSSVFSRRSPVELRLPWIASRAIDVLAQYARPGTRVLEWGCGGSTLFFADRGCQVFSIEHDEAWASVVRENLTARQREHIEIQVCGVPADLGEFADSPYVRAPLGREFDLILVDGYTDYHGIHRNLCFATAETVAARDALILIDDIWMFPQVSASRADFFKTIQGIGPARLGVTATGLFAYGEWAKSLAQPLRKRWALRSAGTHL